MKKKIIALCLSVCMMLSLFVSCGDDSHQISESTKETERSQDKNFLEEGGLLKSCVGQADENGVYVVPETITRIAEGAFAGDTALKEVVIGDNVTFIGSGAFQGCTALEKVTLPEGLTTIGTYAFAYCSALSEITLPSTLTEIDDYTFYACTSLETISLEHVRSIGDSAFLYCSALENLTLSSDLETVSAWAFAHCSALESISFEGVTRLKEISDYAFTGCSMLRSMDIPVGVEKIGILAFYDCTRLRTVTVPETVKTVDYAAFNYTPWYQSDESEYMIVGDGVLIKCAVHPSRIDLTGKGIKMIGGATFRNAEFSGEAQEYGYKYASTLESIVIPEGVREIGKSAFAGCYMLKSVTLPESVLKIDDNAFNIYVEGIDTPASINFEDCKALSYIGSYAFFGCGGIETVTIPDTVEKVGEYAFAVTKAYDSFMANAAKSENESDRFWIVGDGILLAGYVAKGQTKIRVPDGVKMIAGSAFCGWDSGYVPGEDEALSDSGLTKYNITYKVTELHLPEGLVEIGNMAFFRMSKLEVLTLPASLKTIGDDAFGFAESLMEVSGGEGLESVGNLAFRYCEDLKEFAFSSTVQHIGNSVFEGCSSLKTVRFPKTLEKIGSSLFNDSCTALTKIYISPEARARIYSILGSVMQEIDVHYYND